MENNLTQLATTIGEDVKDLHQSQGDLTQLDTVNQNNLVEAINEVSRIPGTLCSV